MADHIAGLFKNSTVSIADSIESFGYLFYAVSPRKTSFETPEEVPDYVVQVLPHFTFLVILEHILLSRHNKGIRVNDAVCSISQGMLQELSRLIVRGVQFTAYTYVYNNWRLATLPWDSAWTWFLCFLGVDLAYYWLHRASHEINIFWAAHQVHHSSEEYNLTTALRQSIFQNYSVWMFNIPLAFVIPPSVFLVHTQFNLLYQFWIHTEVVKSLGPLEYILNTASHHRVHHGRNRYCIDKNYAGTLIIWDRMFGTFEPESEEVVYGLTHPINTFEPFYIQLCHYMHILRTFWNTEGIWNKLSVVFKGPGWLPGTPRLGNIEDIPEVTAPIEKYDPKISSCRTAYVFLHFSLLIVMYREVMAKGRSFPTLVLYGATSYILFSVYTMGILLEKRIYARQMELLRCLLFFALDFCLLPFIITLDTDSLMRFLFLKFTRFTFAVSTLAWLRIHLKHSKSESSVLKKES